MRRRKNSGVLCFLLVILCGFQIKAEDHNSSQSNTNLKELKEIESKFVEGQKEILGIWDQLTIMRKEQKTFETELTNFLRSTTNATSSIRIMLTDQKRMQTEVYKFSSVVHRYQGVFEKWLKDIKILLASNDHKEQYNGCKPFIIELDLMTFRLKDMTLKFVDQAKRYNAFEKILLEMGVVSSDFNKTLSSLGVAIRQIGEHISKIGDPIAIIIERVGDIWQKTNARDRDNSLIKTIKTLLPKAHELVSDGTLQTNVEDNLNNVGVKVENEKVEDEKIEEELKSDQMGEKVPRVDLGAIQFELESLGKHLGDFDSDLEKLKLDMKEVEMLESEFVSQRKDTLKKGNDKKDLNTDLSAKVDKILSAIRDVRSKVETIKPDDRKGIKVLAKSVSELFSRLVEVAKELEQLSNKVLQNGENLVSDQKFRRQHKTKSDLIGIKLKDVGTQIKECGPNFERVGERFSNLGKVLRGTYEKILDNYGQSIQQDGVHLRVHGDKVKHLGDKILILKPSEQNAGIDKATARDFEQIQQNLGDIAKDLENILEHIDTIQKEQDAVIQESKNGYPNEQNLTPHMDHIRTICTRVIEDAKNIIEDSQILINDPPEEIGNAFERITNRLLDLSKKILGLASKFDDVGKILLPNAEELNEKGLLSTEINNILKLQGNNLQDCGSKLESIGKKLANICNKVQSIGRRLTDESAEAGKSLKNSGKELQRLGDQVQEKGEVCQNDGGAMQKLNPIESSLIKGGNANKRETENMQDATSEIGNNLENIIEDLNRIYDELDKTKPNDYNQNNKVILNKLAYLRNECKHLADEERKTIKGQSLTENDSTKSSGTNENALLYYSKQVLTFTQNLENFGSSLISIKHKSINFNKQGKTMERIGENTKNIGKYFGLVKDKLGADVFNFDEIMRKFNDFVEKLKISGDNIVEFGIKLQNSETREGETEILPEIKTRTKVQDGVETKQEWQVKVREEKDGQNAKDLDAMNQALGEIDKDLKNIIEGLKDAGEHQKDIEAEAGDSYPESLEYKLENVREDCEKLGDIAYEIEKELDKAKAISPSDFGKKLEEIGFKLFDLFEKILGSATQLEEIGEHLFKNGERLMDKGKLTFEMNPKLHTQGEMYKVFGGKLIDISERCNVVASKMGGLGNRSKSGDSMGLSLKYKDFVGKIKGQGDSVKKLGIKFQQLMASEGSSEMDDGSVRDIEAMQRGLRDVGKDLGDMVKDLEKIQEKQNGMDSDKFQVRNQIDRLTEKCDDLSDDAKRIGHDLDNLLKKSASQIGKPLVSYGDDIVDLARRVLELSEKLNELGKDIISYGEGLRDNGQLTLDIKGKFNSQGKKFKEIRRKLKNSGERFQEVGIRIDKIGAKLNDDVENGNNLSELAKKLKVLGGKIEDNGSVVENLGIQLQKMRPSKRQDNDIENIQSDNFDNENADDVAEVLRALAVISDNLGHMLKEMNNLNEEQKDVEDGTEYNYPKKGTFPKKLADLHDDSLKIIRNVKMIAEDLDKIQNGPQRDFKKHWEIIGGKHLDLAKKIMVFVDTLEDTGTNILAIGQNKDNLTLTLAERFFKQGVEFWNIGNQFETIGEKFQAICAKLRSVGKRLLWDEDPQLSNLVETLVALGWQIRKMGSKVSDIGKDFKSLKLDENEGDKKSKEGIATDEDSTEAQSDPTTIEYFSESRSTTPTNQDLRQLQRYFDEVANKFENIIKNLGDLNKIQKTLEQQLGRNYTEMGKLSKVIDHLAKNIRILADDTRNIGKDEDTILYETISNKSEFKILDFGKQVLPIAENLEDLANKMLKSGELLQNKNKLTQSIQQRFNDQGQGLRDIEEKIETIGKIFGNISGTLNEMGRKGNGLEYLSGEIEEKGNSVGQLGTKLQQLQPSGSNTDELENENENDTKKTNKPKRQLLRESSSTLRKLLNSKIGTVSKANKEDEECDCDVTKEISQIQKEMNFMLESFRDMEKDMGGMKEQQKRIECGADGCEYNDIWREIEIEEKVTGGLADDTQLILQDLSAMKSLEEQSLGESLVKSGNKFVKLAERVMGLAGKVEMMGIIMEKRGEVIRDEGKMSGKLGRMFQGQGEMMEDVGIKVRGTGGMFVEITNILDGIGDTLDQCFAGVEFAKCWKEYLRRTANETRKLGEKIGERKENFKMVAKMLVELGGYPKEKQKKKEEENVGKDFNDESLDKMESENKDILENVGAKPYKSEEIEVKDSPGLNGELELLLEKLHNTNS